MGFISKVANMDQSNNASVLVTLETTIKTVSENCQLYLMLEVSHDSMNFGSDNQIKFDLVVEFIKNKVKEAREQNSTNYLKVYMYGTMAFAEEDVSDMVEMVKNKELIRFNEGQGELDFFYEVTCFSVLDDNYLSCINLIALNYVRIYEMVSGKQIIKSIKNDDILINEENFSLEGLKNIKSLSLVNSVKTKMFESYLLLNSIIKADSTFLQKTGISVIFFISGKRLPIVDAPLRNRMESEIESKGIIGQVVFFCKTAKISNDEQEDESLETGYSFLKFFKAVENSTDETKQAASMTNLTVELSQFETKYKKSVTNYVLPTLKQKPKLKDKCIANIAEWEKRRNRELQNYTQSGPLSKAIDKSSWGVFNLTNLILKEIISSKHKIQHEFDKKAAESYVANSLSYENMFYYRLINNFSINPEDCASTGLFNLDSLEQIIMVNKHSMHVINSTSKKISIFKDLKSDDNIEFDNYKVKNLAFSINHSIGYTSEWLVESNLLSNKHFIQFDTQMLNCKDEHFCKFAQFVLIKQRRSTGENVSPLERLQSNMPRVASSTMQQKKPIVDQLINIVNTYKNEAVIGEELQFILNFPSEEDRVKLSILNDDGEKALVLRYDWKFCSNFWIQTIHSRINEKIRAYSYTSVNIRKFTKGFMVKLNLTCLVNEIVSAIEGMFWNFATCFEFDEKIGFLVKESDVLILVEKSKKTISLKDGAVYGNDTVESALMFNFIVEQVKDLLEVAEILEGMLEKVNE